MKEGATLASELTFVAKISSVPMQCARHLVYLRLQDPRCCKALTLQSKLIEQSWCSTSKLPWYKPEIGPRLKPVTKDVYERWSGLSGDELKTHLHIIVCSPILFCPYSDTHSRDQRDKAWPIDEYPCIGEWIFLLPGITAFPEYPQILQRAQAGATVLDLGCCFGQNLRFLAASDVPTTQMYAVDINAELWKLGFELFRDKEKMKATFLQADIFGQSSDLQQLDHRMDIIFACQFLHLFDWNQQVIAIKRIVGFSRPGSVLLGFQRAQVEAREIERQWGTMYFHNEETFKKIWQQVGSETGTEWEVSASMVDLQEWGMEDEDLDWEPSDPKGINFVVTRNT